MEHVVLATAGHIDHGKTELTRALTGIDTDRLPEEKARGITIDLGFAHTTFGDRRVAVIDVPGHERFIRNMLAGVGGIDLAMLVISCDESVMPQTREHLAILDLLGVSGGVIALTKLDLVDSEMVELVQLEAQELVANGFLATAPLVPVSARTGVGIDSLREALGNTVAAVQTRSCGGPFRMHVDRAFSVRGFGTVVTGTVWSGRARPGDELEIHPSGRKVKLRGLQVHGGEAVEVSAGARAALNLTGVDLDQIGRGVQLTTPGAFAAVSLIDARLRLLADAPFALKDLSRLHLHLGASEVLARARILDTATTLAPGAEVHVQLRTEHPILAWPGDRFIVRSYSPAVTIGGGRVVDLPVRKHRRGSEEVSRRLDSLATAPLTGRLEQLIATTGLHGVSRRALAIRTGIQPAEIDLELHRSNAIVIGVGPESRIYPPETWRQLYESAQQLLRTFHAENPLREGLSREDLRRRLLGHDAAGAKRLLDDLAKDGIIRLRGEFAALPGHRVELSAGEQALREKMENTIREAGLLPPPAREFAVDAVATTILATLVREGRLLALPGGFHFHRDAIQKLKLRLLSESGSVLSVARFKELTGTSRKHAIPLLEHLDQVRFTRRQGDDRVIVGSPPPASTTP